MNALARMVYLQRWNRLTTTLLWSTTTLRYTITKTKRQGCRSSPTFRDSNVFHAKSGLTIWRRWTSIPSTPRIIVHLTNFTRKNYLSQQNPEKRQELKKTGLLQMYLVGSTTIAIAWPPLSLITQGRPRRNEDVKLKDRAWTVHVKVVEVWRSQWWREDMYSHV